MKEFFTAYGWRETKSWSCWYCNNFHTSGMDLMVDESVSKHLSKCPEFNRTNFSTCTACNGHLTIREVAGFTSHFCNGRWVFINHIPKAEPMSEITKEEREKLEKALDLIADVQVTFLKREETKPRGDRNDWWHELYKCRVTLGEYLYASKKREEFNGTTNSR